MCQDSIGTAIDGFRSVTMLLHPIWRNPASGSVTLAFIMSESGAADMTIFDVRGRRVAEVFRGQPVGAGRWSIQFNVRRLASGVYFVKLHTATGSLSRKMVVWR